jgi:hypothetical protein
MSNSELRKEFERAMIESGGAAQMEREAPPESDASPVVETPPIVERMGLVSERCSLKRSHRPTPTLEDRADQISKLHSLPIIFTAP